MANEKKIPVGGWLDPTTPSNILGSASAIYDENLKKRQSEINESVINRADVSNQLGNSDSMIVSQKTISEKCNPKKFFIDDILDFGTLCPLNKSVYAKDYKQIVYNANNTKLRYDLEVGDIVFKGKFKYTFLGDRLDLEVPTISDIPYEHGYYEYKKDVALQKKISISGDAECFLINVRAGDIIYFKGQTSNERDGFKNIVFQDSNHKELFSTEFNKNSYFQAYICGQDGFVYITHYLSAKSFVALCERATNIRLNNIEKTIADIKIHENPFIHKVDYISNTKPKNIKGTESYYNTKDNSIYKNGVQKVLEDNDIVNHKGVSYLYKNRTLVSTLDSILNPLDDIQYKIGRLYYYDNGVITEDNVSENWASVKLEVSKGDVISVLGYGANRPRLLVYQNKSNEDLYVTTNDCVLQEIPLSFVAWVDGYIYINSDITLNKIFKVRLLSKNFLKEEYKKNGIKQKQECINIHSIDQFKPVNFKKGDIYFNLRDAKFFKYNSTGPSIDVTNDIVDENVSEKIIYNKQDERFYIWKDGYLALKDSYPELSEYIPNCDILSTEYINKYLSGVHFTIGEKGYCENMEDIYKLFDGLVLKYPNYVERVDAAEVVGIPYPEYANLNNMSSGDYLATPSYKTYLYKLIDTDLPFNTKTKCFNKKKLFIVAAVHGDEYAAPFNTFLFASRLCEDFISDYNIWELRNQFDIYIIPCSNGYGLYHQTRNNANNVNINRNYPTDNWGLYGSQSQFPGPSAGSEFETKVVVAWLNKIKPDLALDCHSYGKLARQFYMDSFGNDVNRIIFQNLNDCCHCFIKHFPNKFGTKYKYFIANQDCIIPAAGGTGGFGSYCYTKAHINYHATLEVSQTFNYLDGEINYTQPDNYSAELFSIDEFTLRNGIIRFAMNLH